MRIESGPTGERKVRTLLMFLMLAVFAALFAKDGWIGYPAENREKHLEQLTPEERERARNLPLYDSVTAETVSRAREALQKMDLASQREALEALYGGPPSFEGSGAWYYFGPAFRITFPLAGGRLKDPLAQESQKRAFDILLQKLLAGVLGLVAAYAAWVLVRVARTRLVLDDGGLAYQGRGPVKWEAMKALRTDAFAKKGWLDLVYDDHGTERKMRLDEYHLAKFQAVIDEICARKGFENPLPVDAGESKEQA